MITPQEAARDLIRRKAARAHLIDFITYTKPNYSVNWHHRLVCSKLEQFEQDVRDRKSPRLIVRMSPRGGKSEIISRRSPGFWLGRNPDWQLITTSYNDTIAADMGGDARAVIESDEYRDLFPTSLRYDTHAKDNWRTEQGGIYIAAGVGGGITGRGAHVLTIDDPYKDAADAWSKNTRDNVWDWLMTTAMTRLMPGGGVVILLTSWHDDGLDNRLIRLEQETGEHWDVVDIPARMEANYPGRHPEDHREPGESYWPDFWPVSELEKIQARIGPEAWAALYQQRAIPEGGNIIHLDWIRYWRIAPVDFDEEILSWDLAVKGEVGSSRVVGHRWGKKGADFYLLGRVCKVMEFKESLEKFKTQVAENPQCLTKLIEDKANGPALQSMLEHEIYGLTPVIPDKDKVSRLRAVSPLFASGNVYLPDPEVHPWARDVRDELTRFPNSEYNDDTDACSQALAYWTIPGTTKKSRWRGWKT